MALLEFINQNADWQNLLQTEPYNLDITVNQPYIMIKYRKGQMDFSNPIIKESRGCIVWYNEEKWEYVCRPFDKFCNYEEEYSAVKEINWDSVCVREKVDGSLIKIWFSPYDKNWHLSTNGMIDAAAAYLGGNSVSYYNYFINTIGGEENYKKLLTQLNIENTYMFELVGPENKLVVDYDEPTVYFLRYREKNSGKLGFTTFNIKSIKYPKLYQLKSLDDCVNAAAAMSKNEEGFVVSDAQDNMIKIKSPEYLIAAKASNNGVLTTKRALEIIEENRVDDFLAYAPIYGEKIATIQKLIIELIRILDKYAKIEKQEDRKNHYLKLNSVNLDDDYKKIVVSYGMAYYDNNDIDAYSFLMERYSRSNLEKLLGKMLIQKEG